MTALFSTFVGVGSVGALVLSAHSFVNALLVRRPSLTLEDLLVGESSWFNGPGPKGSGSAGFGSAGAGSENSVTVCIPVRDEERNVGACLQAVLANRGVADLRVVVLDDGSSDDTLPIASGLSAQDARLVVVDGGRAALPKGWIGKTWACERLLAKVETPNVIFVDADVRLEPNAIAASLNMLRAHSLSLVSPYPRQVVGSWAERFVQPLLQWLWMTFLPLRLAERSKAVSLTAANGQFMVLHTEALRSIGGFQSVAGEVLDDVALARRLKRRGYRVAVAEGSSLATCRMYESWNSLRDGYTKNLWSASGSPLGATVMVVMFFGLYLLPILGFLVGVLQQSGSLTWVSIVGYFGAVAGRVITARSTRGSVRDAVFHPVSIAILCWLIVRSWREHLRGAITWKGRIL
jgi:glycosyltransferase involved in cell wall biosynthesis